ncbi:MAG TPA: type II toxin-antitoxin system VapC family toxin [Anaeromyxobacter sp.]
MTLIDTSILVDVQRGRHAARQRLDELLRRPEDLAVSAMTVLEVFAAPRLSAAWSRFFRSVFAAVEILDLDAPAAEEGARLARDMARRGHRLHSADAAIAGCAVRAGAALVVTADADFTELRGLRVEYVQPS